MSAAENAEMERGVSCKNSSFLRPVTVIFSIPSSADASGVISAGTESNTLIVGHDVVATIAELAEQKVDRNVVKDSMSLLPIFKNKAQTEKHEFITHQSKFGPYMAIRQGDWKLIMDIPGVNAIEKLTPFALFNLKDNASEQSIGNLVNDSKHAKHVAKLLSLYVEHRKIGGPTVIDIAD